MLIKLPIIKDNVNILDGCVIGKKGFGFFPIISAGFQSGITPK